MSKKIKYRFKKLLSSNNVITVHGESMDRESLLALYKTNINISILNNSISNESIVINRDLLPPKSNLELDYIGSIISHELIHKALFHLFVKEMSSSEVLELNKSYDDLEKYLSEKNKDSYYTIRGRNNFYKSLKEVVNDGQSNETQENM